jgi:Mg2+-importing ATPase
MGVGVWLPYSPFAQTLGLVPLPMVYWFWIGGFLITYGFVTHYMKTWFFNRYGGD